MDIGETLLVSSAQEWRRWLAQHHEEKKEIWLIYYKKTSGKTGITYEESVEEALCFGWIDGQKKPCDERSWLQKFTPRRAGSGWSKRNTQHAERLMRAGLMESAGRKAVEEAKADGRWQAAYDSPRQAAPPEDFLAALAGNTKARLFFQSLNRANVYAIVYRLQTAKKPETRARRMKMMVEMLERGEKFHL